MTNPNRLPIESMLNDARTALREVKRGYSPHSTGDLACHVMALAAQVAELSRACAMAYNHLDRFGIVSAPDRDPEFFSQMDALGALHRFVRPVGHSAVSIYEEIVKP